MDLSSLFISMKTIAMKPTELLSAQLIDILFAGRNQSYGAYELRKTYSKRINTALLITLFFASAAFGVAALASGTKKKISQMKTPGGFIFTEVDFNKPKEPEPTPERQPQKKQVETRILNEPKIVASDEITHPTPDQETLGTDRDGRTIISCYNSAPPL